MEYYIYENWGRKDYDGPYIHQADCGICNNGQGMIRNADQGKRGVWIGPFNHLDYAIEYYECHFEKQSQNHSCVPAS